MEKIIAILMDAFILNMDSIDGIPHIHDAGEKKDDDVMPNNEATELTYTPTQEPPFTYRK